MIDQEHTEKIVGLISNTQARYIHSIDDDECTDWPEFFVDDCFYQVTTEDNLANDHSAGVIWLDSKAMLYDRVNSLREANIFERHSYRHMVGQPILKNCMADQVECEISFMVARIAREGAVDLFATGRYLDRWLVKENEAKIVSRIVALDSNRIDTLLGYPI